MGIEKELPVDSDTTQQPHRHATSRGPRRRNTFNSAALQKARRAAFLSVPALAEQVGVTERAIVSYETGDRVPPIGTVHALASQLDVTPLDLDPAAEVATTLAQRREQLGMSQKNIAAELGVTDTRISQVERGLALPDSARAWADVYDVTPKALVTLFIGSVMAGPNAPNTTATREPLAQVSATPHSPNAHPATTHTTRGR